MFNSCSYRIPLHKFSTIVVPIPSTGRSYDEEYGIHLLLQLLKYLESINVISFWYVDKAHASPAHIEEQFKLPELYIQTPLQSSQTISSTTTANSVNDGLRSMNSQTPQAPLPPKSLSSETTKPPTTVSSGASDMTSSGGGKKVGGLNIQHTSTNSNQVKMEVAGDGTSSHTVTDRKSSSSMSTPKSTIPQSSIPPISQSKEMTPDEVETHYTQQISAMRKQGSKKL